MVQWSSCCHWSLYSTLVYNGTGCVKHELSPLVLMRFLEIVIIEFCRIEFVLFKTRHILVWSAYLGWAWQTLGWFPETSMSLWRLRDSCDAPWPPRLLPHPRYRYGLSIPTHWENGGTLSFIIISLYTIKMLRLTAFCSHLLFFFCSIFLWTTKGQI